MKSIANKSNKMFVTLFTGVTFLAIAFLTTTSCALLLTKDDQTQRLYYRVWAGYKKPDISEAKFKSTLANQFIPDTTKVGGGKGLHNYIVVLPQKEAVLRPNATLPDELALVVYKTEEQYIQIRATKEGKAYGDLHWEIFNKEISKSEVPLLVTPQTMIEINKAYDVIGKNINWSSGSTAVFIYQRKPAVSDSAYLDEIRSLITEAPDKTLNGRIVLANTGYLVVYEHSEGKMELFQRSFQTMINIFGRVTERVSGAPNEKNIFWGNAYNIY